MLAAALLAGLTGAVTSASPAAPGDLDTSFAGFGTGGIVTQTGVDMASESTLGGMALAPDGRVVTVAYKGFKLLAWRTLPNGQPDATFNNDSYAELQNPDYAIIPHDVAVQPDGAVVVAGRNRHAYDDHSGDFLLLRLKADGQIDASFGQNGYVLTGFYNSYETARQVLIQPDGKIVAAGFTREYDPSGGVTLFAVARYTTGGLLDPAFGGGDGLVTIEFGSYAQAYDLALQSDGKLVLAGAGGASGDAHAFALVRLNADGSLDDDSDGDSGFGGDGKVTTSSEAPISAIAIQPDGRIVALGNLNGTSYMARYEPDGDLDTSFGPGGLDGDGRLTLPGDSLRDLALQPDGKMVLLGHDYDPASDHFTFYRLLDSGELDVTFGFGGLLKPNLGVAYEYGNDLALLPDGRILGFGLRSTDTVRATSLALVRLWPNGRLDAGGTQTHAVGAGTAYPPGSDEYANALAVHPDGRLLVAGELRNPNGTRSDAVVTRFLTDGQVDTTFGAHGTAYAFSGVFNVASAIALQTDGKIVIAGHTGGNGLTDDFLIARFHPNGTPDTGFGDAFGAKAVHFGSGHDTAYALALTPDGKIIVVGDVFNGSTNIWGVLRLTSAGQPDPTFGPSQDGKAFIHLSNTASAQAVVVQSDGKVVVAGHVSYDAAIVRLLETGLSDASFGAGGATIKDLGGFDGINALVLAPNGWFYAAGSYRNSQNNTNDFALAQFRPDGTLAECSDPAGCGYWSTGTAFADWGGNDIAVALDWRSDNQLVAAGVSDGRFAAAQFSTTDSAPSPLKYTTDFAGSYEIARSIRFTGTDKVVMAGLQDSNSDWNIALARFETTVSTPPPTSTPPTPPGPTPPGPTPNTHRLYLPAVVR
jgi:uncharacterized delta-60 repeat protein